MKKLLLCSVAIIGAISLGGCERIDTFLQVHVINPTASLITNPNTQLVAKTVTNATTALACIIDAGTSIAGSLEANPAFNAGISTQGTNLKINVASAAACKSLQGVVSGNVTVAAGGVVVAAQ